MLSLPRPVTKWRLKQLEEENLCLKMEIKYEAIKSSRATDKLEGTSFDNFGTSIIIDRCLITFCL